MANPRVLTEITCSCCGKINKHEIDLFAIFEAVMKKNPATKGPVDSIKALLNHQKPMIKAF